MKGNLHTGKVQILIVQLNMDICIHHMYPPPHQNTEYSRHSLCLCLVNLPFKPELDTILIYLYHQRLVLSVLELHNNGVILFHVYIYVLFCLAQFTQDYVYDIYPYCYFYHSLTIFLIAERNFYV